jgi:raffinose/stachyose/melibiose transport system permease protein
MLKQRFQIFGVHAILIAYCALALGPILLVVMNSFKTRNEIFGAPLAPPPSSTFAHRLHEAAFNASHIGTYFMNR